MARGLFHKAIGESGAAFSACWAAKDSQRAKEDDEWVATLGVNYLAECERCPTEKILPAVKDKRKGFPPDIDGKLLTEPVANTYTAGKQAHVPLLAGWNPDEDGSLQLG